MEDTPDTHSINTATLIRPALPWHSRVSTWVAAACVLGFIGLGIAFGFKTVIRSPIEFVMGLEPGPESRDKAVACRDPRNRDTVYCQEYLANQQKNWQRASRFEKTDSTAFSLE